MDLRTALERLRKHGVVRDGQDEEPEAAAPAHADARAPAAHEPPHPATADIPRVDPMDASGGLFESFDEIFAEVEGLVRGTLEDSVDEVFAEARAAAAAPPPPEPEPDFEPAPRSAYAAAARAPVAAPEPEPEPAPDPMPEVPSEPLSRRLPRPEEDVEEEPVEEASAEGPYDWGVKPASRPAGAWLLEDGAEDIAKSAVTGRARGEGTVDAGRDVETEADEPSLDKTIPLPPLGGAETPPATPAPSMAAGASGLLGRQLQNESRRFQPCVDKLVERGILSPGDVGEEDEDEDDEVSVASFQDDRPRGDLLGMTPMRIVEEIRRLRRIQDALIRKGILTEDEMSSTTHGD